MDNLDPVAPKNLLNPIAIMDPLVNQLAPSTNISSQKTASIDSIGTLYPMESSNGSN